MTLGLPRAERGARRGGALWAERERLDPLYDRPVPVPGERGKKIQQVTSPSRSNVHRAPHIMSGRSRNVSVLNLFFSVLNILFCTFFFLGFWFRVHVLCSVVNFHGVWFRVWGVLVRGLGPFRDCVPPRGRQPSAKLCHAPAPQKRTVRSTFSVSQFTHKICQLKRNSKAKCVLQSTNNDKTVQKQIDLICKRSSCANGERDASAF